MFREHILNKVNFSSVKGWKGKEVNQTVSCFIVTFLFLFALGLSFTFLHLMTTNTVPMRCSRWYGSTSEQSNIGREAFFPSQGSCRQILYIKLKRVRFWGTDAPWESLACRTRWVLVCRWLHSPHAPLCSSLPQQGEEQHPIGTKSLTWMSQSLLWVDLGSYSERQKLSRVERSISPHRASYPNKFWSPSSPWAPKSLSPLKHFLRGLLHLWDWAPCLLAITPTSQSLSQLAPSKSPSTPVGPLTPWLQWGPSCQ